MNHSLFGYLIFLLLSGLAVAGGKQPVELKEKKGKKAEETSWCDWLQDSPGLLYDNKDNPYIQSFELGGRFQYQAAYVDGRDVNGRNFHETYDEYRRFRLGAGADFLRYFTADVSVNLVDDRRFRDAPPRDLDWGYDDFDTLTLKFDIDKAFGGGALDKIHLTYGRMKMPMGHEAHTSSRRILTIERSSISDRINGNESRPTGGILALGKGDWDFSLGVFSDEDDSEALGGWNDGESFYGSLEWAAAPELTLIYDHVQNSHEGTDVALGYAWAGTLSGIYEVDEWGLLVNGIYGDNGGADHGRVQPRRQGDFWGAVAMPWYWIKEDRLQAVLAYQYQASDREEGIQVQPRYLRAGRGDLLIDVENGRGNREQTFYGGLNYHFCGDNAKLMGGVSYTRLDTRNGDVSVMSYMVAFRSYF